MRVSLLALTATVAIVAARFSAHWMSLASSMMLRDWVPAILMLVPYWQVGQFLTAPDPAMEARLAGFDRQFFRKIGVQPPRTAISGGIAAYLQLAYLMVYPLIPLALIVLYATGLRKQVDFFWLVVLSATNICFALTLFVRASPPRMLPECDRFRIPPTWVGRLNRGILDHGSIQAVTCPSAHVAASLAAAMVLLRLEPWVGAIFLWLAFSIAVATIVGGYHYIADVLLAAVTAVLTFAITISI
jgi:membrane-associated phospholipid phosphatase